MKRISFFAICCLVATLAFSQNAKQPTLMVVPSDAWCNNNGYVLEFDNQGTTQIVPDYQAALQSDMDLKLVIAKLSEMFIDRNFPLKNMEQTLKGIQQMNAESNLLTSKAGNEMAESPVDRLLRTAKADIIIELSWEVKENGPKRTLSFILEGKDAYTGKSVAGASGTSSPSFSAEPVVLLEEAVLAHIDNFNNRLMGHFEDMFTKGREVALDIRVFADNEAGIDLESEFDGVELSEIIDDWMSENTVEHRFSKLGSSENYISYEQVRIPIFDASGRPMDTEMFARQLRNVLRKAPYNVPVKVMNRGLGRCVLVLGEK